MANAATRTYVRHAGDRSPEQQAERDRRAAERREALEARQAEFRAMHPELMAQIEAKMNRRGR